MNLFSYQQIYKFFNKKIQIFKFFDKETSYIEKHLCDRFHLMLISSLLFAVRLSLLATSMAV